MLEGVATGDLCCHGRLLLGSGAKRERDGGVAGLRDSGRLLLAEEWYDGVDTGRVTVHSEHAGQRVRVASITRAAVLKYEWEETKRKTRGRSQQRFGSFRDSPM